MTGSHINEIIIDSPQLLYCIFFVIRLNTQQYTEWVHVTTCPIEYRMCHIYSFFSCTFSEEIVEVSLPYDDGAIVKSAPGNQGLA